jgi:hypothetical protein
VIVQEVPPQLDYNTPAAKPDTLPFVVLFAAAMILFLLLALFMVFSLGGFFWLG